MAKEKVQQEELTEYFFPLEGVTIKAKDQADANVKLKELLKANK